VHLKADWSLEAKVKTDIPEKNNKKTSGVRGVSPVSGKVEEHSGV